VEGAETRPLRELGRVFDDVAVEYDAVRPGYPAGLVDVALEAGALDGGSAVLEIGCGTGKLTERLVARGLRVHAVEPGAKLVEAARRRLGPTAAVRFEIARFEDAELADDFYDAVFSATAFHWVEPSVGWAKAASVLKPGGLLALLTYIGVRDERSAAMEEQFMALLREHAPALAATWKPLPDLASVITGAEQRSANASAVWDWVMSDGRHAMTLPEVAHLFDGIEVVTVLARERHTADEVLAHTRTTSFWFMLPADRRDAFASDYRRLIDSHGGTFPNSRADVLMTARKAGTSARLPLAGGR
jgi:SAM-dependent methyltransferase